MNSCEVSCAAARAPLLRNKVDVVHYRPGEECEKVGAQNEPDIVRIVCQEVAGFHVYLDTRELLLSVDTRKCAGGVDNHGTVEMLLTIHSAIFVFRVECICCVRYVCVCVCCLLSAWRG